MNITVSRRGGLVLCEDGGGDEFLHGLTLHGSGCLRTSMTRESGPWQSGSL
jgi:hypothetical protein